MNEFFEKMGTTLSNPFIVAIVIVLVISFMTLFFFKPQVGRKVFFRNTFYTWIIITGIMYLHHRTMFREYEAKLQTSSNLSAVARTTGAFEDLAPNLTAIEPKTEVINLYSEDDLI